MSISWQSTNSRVFADRGGMAAGRDNIIGILPKELPAIIRAATDTLEHLNSRQKQTILKLETALGVTRCQLRAFFRIINDAAVPPEAMPARLLQVAEHYNLMVLETSTSFDDETELTELKAKLKAALDRPDFDMAEKLFDEILETQDRALDARLSSVSRLALAAAVTCAQRGELCMTRMQYRDAAVHFASAAARVLHSHDLEHIRFLDRRAFALFRQGVEFGEKNALLEAARACSELLAISSVNIDPVVRSDMHINHGSALAVLGERGDRGALNKSVRAFEVGLRGITRDRWPHQWAKAQHALGQGYQVLGDQGGDDTALRKAIDAYTGALPVFELRDDRSEWADTQNDLGIAFKVLGQRGDKQALSQALQAFTAALKVRTRTRAPLQWAQTQNNIGNVFHILGTQGDGNATQLAVNAFRNSLLEYTREGRPLQWAASKTNLANSLLVLGQRGDEAALRGAIQEYKDALTEFQHRSSFDFAVVQNNLGVAYKTLGHGGDDNALRCAIEFFNASLREFTRDKWPLRWAMTQSNLGDALQLLGERGDTDALGGACIAYEAALQEFSHNGDPADRSWVEKRLKRVHELLASRFHE